MVVHAFTHSIKEAEEGRSLSGRPAWSTLQVLDMPMVMKREPTFKKKKLGVSAKCL